MITIYHTIYLWNTSSHRVGCVLKQENKKDILTPVAYQSRNLKDYRKIMQPNINKDIENYVKHCHTCQINKKCKQKRFGDLQQMPPTEKPFECLALDTVGGFNYYNSTKKYLHLVTDHATLYVWGFPSKSATTESYANFLKQIFKIQVPEKLLTDRNATFTESKFKKLLLNYDVKHIMTSSHHSETNGKIECLNQTAVTRLETIAQHVMTPTTFFSTQNGNIL